MRSSPVKKFLPTLCLIFLFAWLPPAEAGEGSDWEVRIGAGAEYIPKYEGSDEMRSRALPLVDITWKDLVFLHSRDGLGVHLYNEGGLTVSASVEYVFARDESDSDDLRGMGDIDETAAATLIVKYDLGLLTPYAGVSKHLGGTEGTLVKAGVGGIVPLALLDGSLKPQAAGDDGPTGPALKLAASITWADDTYMENYFGVNPAQSSASGHPRYSPESGFKSVDLEAGVIWLFAENWVVIAQVGYSRLSGDATDSPIVKDDGRFSGGLFLSYGF
ncbi:MAG: MipA/OmpV family protein [Nitrospinae bacterium]|nr:MipA/OmpV family protein [Nitrospinota bacterium]